MAEAEEVEAVAILIVEVVDIMLMPIITTTNTKIMDTVMMSTQDKEAMVEVVVTIAPRAGIDKKTPTTIMIGTCLPKKPESQATEPMQTLRSPKEDGKNTKEKARLAKLQPQNTTSRAEVLAESLRNKTILLKRRRK